MIWYEYSNVLRWAKDLQLYLHTRGYLKILWKRTLVDYTWVKAPTQWLEHSDASDTPVHIHTNVETQPFSKLCSQVRAHLPRYFHLHQRELTFEYVGFCLSTHGASLAHSKPVVHISARQIFQWAWVDRGIPKFNSTHSHTCECAWMRFCLLTPT